jgi:dihydroorotate dehydrogenase
MTFKEKVTSIYRMFYSLIKPLLFSLDPESAHNLTLHVAHLCPALGKISGATADPSMELKVGSVQWTFPIGLAAGLDKNAEALEFLGAQGFGAVECGTVTLKSQMGNPRPRIFRYPEEQSLRNAMGFPNEGMLTIMPRLKAYEGKVPLGVNIGKNKDSSTKESIEELSILFDTLRDFASYFVINVSSPNTPGLRALQESSYLSELFTILNERRSGRDLYLKIAPDLPREKIAELTCLARDFGLTGIISSNTTIMPERGMGGISGALLKEKSREVREIVLKEKGTLELIAVGGFTDPQDLFDLWKDGGKAAQVYTAYVFQGPQLLKKFHSSVKKFVTEQKITLNQFFELSESERNYRVRTFRL